MRAAQNVDRKLITGVTVFDVYEGKGIEPGKKSIAIAVTLQPRDKTMTDEEIEALGGEDRRGGEQAHRRRAARLADTFRCRPRAGGPHNHSWSQPSCSIVRARRMGPGLRGDDGC